MQLQLHALFYNLATFLRAVALLEEAADASFTSLQLKLIKIGACVVRHPRAILATIRRLRAPPLCAWPRFTPKVNESSGAGLPAALKNTAAEPEHDSFDV